jgi:hypothetical protein
LYKYANVVAQLRYNRSKRSAAIWRPKEAILADLKHLRLRCRRTLTAPCSCLKQHQQACFCAQVCFLSLLCCRVVQVAKRILKCLLIELRHRLPWQRVTRRRVEHACARSHVCLQSRNQLVGFVFSLIQNERSRRRDRGDQTRGERSVLNPMGLQVWIPCTSTGLLNLSKADSARL